MRTRSGKTMVAGIAVVLALAGCGGEGDPGSTPAPPRPPATDGAFGVFAALAPEFASFWTSLGLDFAGYQQWAGARMEDLGAGWSRSDLQLVWDLVEPVPGAGFDWTASFESDAVFAAAARHGVEYLAVFHEGGGDASGGKAPLRDPLDDLEGYARFVEAAVERYDGDGVGDAPGGIAVRHWQVGNETMRWTGTGRDADGYARWFEATAAAIRRADPEARVVTIAATDGDAVDPLLAAAVPALAARGVRVDAVDVHHWGTADLASSTMDAAPAYRALLDGAGATEAEIWSCEHGTYVGMPVPRGGTCTPACGADQACSPISTCVPRCTSDASCPAHHPFCEGTSGLCTDRPPQTQADQARSLVYRYAVNRDLGVRRILWNNLAGFRCLGTCGDYFDRLGLVADGYGPGETPADVGKPRTAYFAFRMLAERTDDAVASPDGRVDAGDPAVHAYAYRLRASGARGLVAWADAQMEGTLPFAGAAALVTGFATDADGVPLRSEELAAEGGQLVIALDPDPVWIEEAP